MKRIALCGIGSENCTFSPDRFDVEDFTIYRGSDLDARYAFAHDDAYSDLEAVNLVMARALPGGPIKQTAFDELVALITDELSSQGPWDAVYLDLHGAMYVDGMLDAENEFARRVQAAVGEECLLGASFDLHGNLSGELVSKLVALSAYRTAPHLDEPETRARAFRLLVETLRSGERMHLEWLPIPVLLPGECTSTQYDPGKSLYASLPVIQQREGLSDLSLLVGYAWADEPRSSACVVALGPDADRCRAAAKQVASEYWKSRNDFSFGMEALPFADALQAALPWPERPVVISDSGDNPTAGGVGNLVVALREVLATKTSEPILVAGIWDARVTADCFAAGEAATNDVTAGTAMDAAYGESVSLRVKVEKLHTGDAYARRQAVVSVAAQPNVKIIFTERRKPFHYRDDFLQLGIVPEDAGIFIVKIGYLVPDLLALARKHWLGLTPGAVDQDLMRLPYKKIRRPIFPMDRDFSFPDDD